MACCMGCSQKTWQQLLVVMRHSERLDFADEDAWFQHPDSRSFPMDPPITTRGKSLAKFQGQTLTELCNKLGTPIDVVITSPFHRCVQTAAAIIEVLPMRNGKKVPILIDCEIAEVGLYKKPPGISDPGLIKAHQEFCSRRRTFDEVAALPDLQGIEKLNANSFVGIAPPFPEQRRSAHIRGLYRFAVKRQALQPMQRIAAHPDVAVPGGPAHRRGELLTPGQSARIEWFRRQVLYRVCCSYLEFHYKTSGCNERSAVQRLSGFRRAASGLGRTELEQLVRPRLEEPAVTNVSHDLQQLEDMLDGPVLPNDMGWIFTIGVPYSGVPGPPKALLVQQLQTMLSRRFMQRLRFPEADLLAMELVDLCTNALYQELVISIWPMLGAHFQYELQQWFFRYACEARDGVPCPGAPPTLQATGSGDNGGPSSASGHSRA
ncbi:sec31 [Symbiodinium necroappetens]|uniref:Sec31 protein n=1 Tax=Symbiodinium necroappetens TaxID=1628268 RepID=A0A812TGZ8_9DINO|nr:sec31 [Symbiodinium necroappetens]